MQGIIFDLDGVLVSTDQFHYLAWKKIADAHGIAFNWEINHKLRGVSRVESLEILLQATAHSYSQEEKEKMAIEKNDIYLKLLENLNTTAVFRDAVPLLEHLKQQEYQIAIGSSSKNAQIILRKIGLYHYFDAIADGTEIKRSKPDPEVFLLAAKKLKLTPQKCIVIEDSTAGIDAAIAAGMISVLVGDAQTYHKCHHTVTQLSCLKNLVSFIASKNH